MSKRVFCAVPSSMRAKSKYSDKKIDNLKSQLWKKLEAIMQEPEFGFTKEEAALYSKVTSKVSPDGDRIYIHVSAEVGYSSLMYIAENLNPILQKFDSEAYFDAETSGRLIGVIDLA